MSPSEAGEIIGALSPDSPWRQPALRLILSGTARPDPGVDQRVRTLKAIVAAQGMDLALLVAARRAQRPVAAGLAIESPGRTGFVHFGSASEARGGHNTSVRVLMELQNQAWRRGLVLLQAMASPEEGALEHLLAAAGFRFLAELIYADCLCGIPVPAMRTPPVLEWLTYTPQRHKLFLHALERTYTESLDCPDLAGVRQTEDVLAGHRATGRHDPALWFLARLGGEAVGVLLLSPVPERQMLEVAYMGVGDGFRRLGVGHALMCKCHEEMMACRFAGVTLAVDSVNTPARALYSRWGFVETARRRVWIAVHPGTHTKDLEAASQRTQRNKTQ